VADEKQVEVEAEKPWKAKDRKSADKPIIAPDGHVVLSQEDIDARDS
jgi:hypothetical protein